MEAKAKTLFNLKEAAAYLGISVPTLAALLHEGTIPCRRAGQLWVPVPKRKYYDLWLQRRVAHNDHEFPRTTCENKCEMPHLYKDQLRGLFLDAMSDYLSDHKSTIVALQYAQRSLTDTDFIDEDIRTLERELEITSEMISVCINSNASKTITETEYRTKHSELCGRFMDTGNRLNALKQRRKQMKNDAIAIGGMLFEFSELYSLPITFNEKLWIAAIDRVMVYADYRVVFHFKDGKNITERL